MGAGAGATGGPVVRLQGRVDAASVATLRLQLLEAVDAGAGDLRVDVSGIVLGDASGLGALLTAHRRAARAGRRLVLVAPPPTLLRLLAVTRLSRVLAVEPAGAAPAAARVTPTGDGPLEGGRAGRAAETADEADEAVRDVAGAPRAARRTAGDTRRPRGGAAAG